MVQLQKVPDDDTKKAGEIAFNILTNVYGILQSREVARRSSYAVNMSPSIFILMLLRKSAKQSMHMLVDQNTSINYGASCQRFYFSSGAII